MFRVHFHLVGGFAMCPECVRVTGSPTVVLTLTSARYATCNICGTRVYPEVGAA